MPRSTNSFWMTCFSRSTAINVLPEPMVSVSTQLSTLVQEMELPVSNTAIVF